MTKVSDQGSVKKLLHDSKAAGLSVEVQSSYEQLCKQVKDGHGPGLFILSTPHGPAVDKLLKEMRPHLDRGDVIVDCGNEHWESTERRQQELGNDGIHLIGCGVSGGYQSARSGPSFSPGGDAEVLDKLMPFFEGIAAKDRQGRPCVRPVGPGSSGHYVKMVHNGIEQGMLSVLSEVWFILVHGLGLSYPAVADIFASWNRDGPLHDCFLIGIAADGLRARNPEGGGFEVDVVRDKVVQDVEDSEGTGNWACEEAMALHMPAATIATAHMFRYASAYASDRKENREAASGVAALKPGRLRVESRDDFVALLQRATYFCFLCCFVQGMDLLRAKDSDRGWGLDYTDIMQLWRGGCIIQADGIVNLLDDMYKRHERPRTDDVLADSEVAKELSSQYPAAKQVVLEAVRADLYVPAVSQSLEYYKYMTSTALPTQFMEAQLDYFGEHMFDTWDEPPGEPRTGAHHYEWKAARGKVDE